MFYNELSRSHNSSRKLTRVNFFLFFNCVFYFQSHPSRLNLFVIEIYNLFQIIFYRVTTIS